MFWIQQMSTFQVSISKWIPSFPVSLIVLIVHLSLHLCISERSSAWVWLTCQNYNQRWYEMLEGDCLGSTSLVIMVGWLLLDICHIYCSFYHILLDSLVIHKNIKWSHERISHADMLFPYLKERKGRHRYKIELPKMLQ